MKYTHILFCLFTFCVAMLHANQSAMAQSDTAIYKAIGGNFEDEFKSVIYDNDSNLVYCGTSSSINDYGSKALLVKTDTLLNVIWSSFYGEYAISHFTDIVRSGDTYIATGSILNATSSYDVLVAAFNEDGELLWDRHFGGVNWDLANSISLLSDGFLITADTYSNSGRDALVIKLDTNGDLLWQEVYSSAFDQSLLDGNESIEGNLVFGGFKELNDSTTHQWFLKTNAEGTVLLESEFTADYRNSINSIISDPFEEAYFICGHLYNSINESQDAFISKLSSDGLIEFTDTLLSIGTQTYYNIELGLYTELLSTGYTEDGDFGNEGKDIILKRLTRDNLFIDQKSFGTQGDEEGACAVRIDNGYIISGYTNGMGQGQKDGFIVRTRNNGSDVSFSTSEELLEGSNQTTNIGNSQRPGLPSFFISNDLLMFSQPIDRLDIYSITGALVYSTNLTGKTSTSLPLKTGVYFVNLDGTPLGKLFWK